MRRTSSREAVLVLTVGCILLNLAFRKKIFLDIGLAIGVAGLLSAALSERIDWAWSRFGTLLGTVSNTVLLTLAWYLVLTPVGLVRRLQKKDRMTHFDPDKKSQFLERDHTFRREDLERPW